MTIIQCVPVYASVAGRAVRHAIGHAWPHRIGHHAHHIRRLAHAAISKPAIIGYTCTAIAGGAGLGGLGALGGGLGEGGSEASPQQGGSGSIETTYPGALAGLDIGALAFAPLSSLAHEMLPAYHDTAPMLSLSEHEHAAVASGPESGPNHGGAVVEASPGIAPVPEPGTLALLLIPLLAAFALGKGKTS